VHPARPPTYLPTYLKVGNHDTIFLHLACDQKQDKATALRDFYPTLNSPLSPVLVAGLCNMGNGGCDGNGNVMESTSQLLLPSINQLLLPVCTVLRSYETSQPISIIFCRLARRYWNSSRSKPSRQKAVWQSLISTCQRRSSAA